MLPLLKSFAQTSLVVQWLRVHLPTQGMRVRSLAWEDSTGHGELSLCATTKTQHHQKTNKQQPPNKQTNKPSKSHSHGFHLTENKSQNPENGSQGPLQSGPHPPPGFPSLSAHTLMPATLASSLFLERNNNKPACASGSLHWLFLPLRTLFPHTHSLNSSSSLFKLYLLSK